MWASKSVLPPGIHAKRIPAPPCPTIDRSSWTYKEELSLELKQIGSECARLHREERHEEALLKNMELRQKLVQFHSDPVQIARSDHNQGTILRHLGRFDEARSFIERTLHVRRGLGHAGYKELAAALQDLALVHEHLRDADRAIAAHTEASDLILATDGADSTGYANALSLLGGALILSRRYEEAAVRLEKALRILQANHAPMARQLAPVLHKLGVAYSR